MRAPGFAVCLLLLLAPLTGCIAGEDASEPLEAQNETNQSPEDPPRTERFPGDPNATGSNGTGDGTGTVDDAANRSEVPEPSEPPVQARYRLTGFDGAEPTIGATANGTLLAAARDELIRSTDGGLSWEVVHRIGPDDESGEPTDLVGSYDPMMWVDPVTDRVFHDPMFPPLACTTMAWSDDDGASWFERGPVCHAPPMDHQKLASGPVPEDAPPIAGERYPSVLYHCYGSGNLIIDPPGAGPQASPSQTWCAMSYDGGLTWPLETGVANAQVDPCGGNIGQPDVSPNGTVAVPITDELLCDRPAVALSTDAGQSWRVVEVPAGQPSLADDAQIAFGPEGTLYIAYAGADHVTYLASTSDLGLTWNGPFRVTPPSVESTVFHALEAGPDGRIATAFLGTRDTTEGADAAPNGTHWHLFLVRSEDANIRNPSFTSHQATPADDPVQIGRICQGGATGCMDGSRNLLDFIDGAMAPNGTFYAAYTEGCIDSCDADATPEDSRARATAIAWLDGWSLDPQASAAAASDDGSGSSPARGSATSPALSS